MPAQTHGLGFFPSVETYIFNGWREFHERVESLHKTQQTEQAEGKHRVENGRVEQGRPQHRQEADLPGADLVATSGTI